jgi:hypothetical protein
MATQEESRQRGPESKKETRQGAVIHQATFISKGGTINLTIESLPVSFVSCELKHTQVNNTQHPYHALLWRGKLILTKKETHKIVQAKDDKQHAVSDLRAPSSLSSLIVWTLQLPLVALFASSKATTSPQAFYIISSVHLSLAFLPCKAYQQWDKEAC